jgi:hypothetical protein
LPRHRRSSADGHSLSQLAAATRARALEADLDPLAAIAYDAQRFSEVSRPAWALSGQHRPNVLVIARLTSHEGPYPLDRFVGIPRYPWQTPLALEVLLRSSATLVRQQVVTCFGETVEADLYGAIFTQHLRCAMAGCRTHAETSAGVSDHALLRNYLHPRRTVRPAAPELFTWSSAFNGARDGWPGVAGLAQLTVLTAEQQTSIANHFLGYGLEALAAEAQSRHVRLAAGRLLAMCEAGLIDVQVTSEPGTALRKLRHRHEAASRMVLPELHGLAYVPVPAGARSGQRATILAPLQWIACALSRPIVGLTHLTRIASIARDDYFGVLAGRDVSYCRGLGLVAEVSRFDVALSRADRLAATFLDEAVRFDNRVYGLQVNRDTYCRVIERQQHRPGFYEDPHEPRSRWNGGARGTRR